MSTLPPSASFSSIVQDQQPLSFSSEHDISQSLDLSRSMDEQTVADPSRSGEKHPKGRRKRTSAKDKMILEEAYSTNDKPDKQARLEIVKRVDLNEKEVQIWFQNRRQNDRRRSRPLSQEEIQAIAARQYSARHAIPSSEPMLLPTPNNPPPVPDASTSRLPEPTTSSPHALQNTSPQSVSQSHFALVHSTPVSASQEAVPRELPDSTPQHPEPSPSQDLQGGPYSWPNSLMSSASSSIGYLANRRNLGSSFTTPSASGRGDDSLKLDSFPPSTHSPEASQPASQTQSQSSVRLSLSLEGKAELVSNQASPTPNPPQRPSSTPNFFHQRQRSFGRSFSDLEDLTLPPIKGFDETRHPRLRRIRSRDVHAWESCADPDTRDELTAQAEHESNGSAIAAINLLRSSSSGVLQMNMSKRNAPLSSKQSQAKRAKISRTTSSVARLETDQQENEEPEKDPSGKLKISRLLSPTDSDKENWSPGADGNPLEPNGVLHLSPYVPPKTQNARRRPLQTGAKLPNFLGSRASTAPVRHRSVDDGIEIFEDSPKRLPPPGEPSVQRFMRSGELSPSKRPDMDCAAGLLSLSRGGWQNRQASS